jgi:hypothetical protein
VKHLVQFSTGLSSAEVAWRLVGEHGPGDVVLLTADTTKEDDDNWRFGREVQARLGAEWIKLTDGRTPMQLGLDRKMIPNDNMPACSINLKQKVLRAWMKANYDPGASVIYIGYDWSEPNRIRGNQFRYKPWAMSYPLADDPPKVPLDRLFRSRGIEPPRLYNYPFSHANCGGACVRGGIAQWLLLLDVNRDRFLEWEAEEEHSRRVLGKDVAILTDRAGGHRRPLPLVELRHRREDPGALFSLAGLDTEDWGACGCEMAADPRAEDGGADRVAKAERWDGAEWEPISWPQRRAA